VHSTVEVGGVTIDVVRKDIKTVRLSVRPPAARVRISAPRHASLDAIRLFATSKLGWIERQRARVLARERDAWREYEDGERHSVWGEPLVLRVTEASGAPRVHAEDGALLLRIRPGAERERREAAVSAWYRQVIKDAIPPLIEAWEPRLSVKVSGFRVRKMRTRWGSCSPSARTIRLNSELAKRPRECLEYVVVHEMAHLREPSHGARFVALMDEVMPEWRSHRDVLKQPLERQEQSSL
jgi:hypothetical protein